MPAENPKRSVHIEYRGLCNGGRGRSAYVENSHPGRRIRVTIKVTARGTNRYTRNQVLTLPPRGDASLGCTDGSGGGQPQTFSFEITRAEFVGAAPSENPKRFAHLEYRGLCNGGRGRSAYVESSHATRRIAVTIRITARGTHSYTRTHVLRLGPRGDASLGCTDGSGTGQPQSFSFEIVGAEFVS